MTNKTISPTEVAYTVRGDYAAGTPANIISALGLFYYNTKTSISGEWTTNTISDSEIRTWISGGVPICALLTSAHKYGTPPKKLGHAVTVCGYSTTRSGKCAIRVMNSGTGRIETMTKSSSTSPYAFYYANDTFYWSNGQIVLSGWQKPYGNSTWSYLASNGTKCTGWKSINGYWYYFNSSGVMQTGWQKINGSWYLLHSSGHMLTGWQKVDGYWYYMASNGKMQTGWLTLDGKTYYLRTASNVPSTGPKGSMVSGGTYTINGKSYTFNSSGVCQNA